MPVLYPSVDGGEAPAAGAGGPDPIVMYLVAPHRPSGSTGELLACAAAATVGCAREFEASAEWEPAFGQWEASSFRKVCLRARPEEFERARRLDHVRAGEVLCFPPRRRSAAEPELADLQAHIGGPLSRSGRPVDLPGGAMLLLICQELQMTAGKACAQVGHGVLLGRRLHRRGAVIAWERDGCPLAVGLVDSSCFERVKSALEVVGVRDAGLTQVRAGAETVLVTEPGASPPGWLLAGMATIR